MPDVALRESELTTRDGLRLRMLRWATASAPGRTIVFVHGYLEHAERYREIAERFVVLGYTCYAMDLRGHGRSEGVRGYAPDFSAYLDDLGRLLDTVRQDVGGAGVFLVGHSFGGLIALAHATGHSELAGVAVSSPYLRNAVRVSRARLVALHVLVRVAPKLQVPSQLDARDLTRDPAIVAAHATDPLMLRHYTPGWALATRRAQRATLDAAPRLTLPLLVMAAGADVVADPSGAREFYERAGSRDKTLLWYDLHHHENFNELDRQRVYADLDRWLAQHGSSAA